MLSGCEIQHLLWFGSGVTADRQYNFWHLVHHDYERASWHWSNPFAAECKTWILFMGYLWVLPGMWEQAGFVGTIRSYRNEEWETWEQVPVIFEEIFSFSEEQEPGDVDTQWNKFISKSPAAIYTRVYTSMTGFGFTRKMGDIQGDRTVYGFDGWWRGMRICSAGGGRRRTAVQEARLMPTSEKAGNGDVLHWEEKLQADRLSVGVAGEVGLDKLSTFHLFKEWDRGDPFSWIFEQYALV